MEHLLPREAHAFIQQNPNALFVDCRSDAEYFFVGHAVGSIHVAWCEAPDWELNPHFTAEVRKLAAHVTERPVVLICRSGRRSAEAGLALEAAGFSQVYNVTHGFEGDLNADRQRGKVNGWRFDGLPWEQF
ncbi:MAG: rhodanese-like domain-containing protein [Betaproteobacteria bacterium]|nr:rhodanese-like domain-containing protein [Betaproteobacteria bacterium]